mgnify:FL=1
MSSEVTRMISEVTRMISEVTRMISVVTTAGKTAFIYKSLAWESHL